MLKLFNWLRRNIIKLIYPNYINKKILKRKGECRMCGDCCKGCKYLKNNKCLVYEKRPGFCNKDFPIDNFDKKVFRVKNCGYWF